MPRKVQNTILLVGEISDIYVTNFQKMLADPHFRVEELTAIAFGYTKLLQESADMLLELKDVVNVNGLSMTDSERMDIVTKVYDRLKKASGFGCLLYTKEHFDCLSEG